MLDIEESSKYDDVISEYIGLGIAIMDAKFTNEEKQLQVFNKVMANLIDEVGPRSYKSVMEVFKREYNL